MQMLNEQIIADNRALIARNRELECELAQLKVKLGAVGRIADGLNGEARQIVHAFGDEPLPAATADRCAALFHAANEIKEALR